MSTRSAAWRLPNPMMTASGCAGYGRELDQFFDITEIGAVVTKSIMLEPRSGRATPRMAETPSGMLNSIGLQGPGIDAFIARDLAWLRAARRARSWCRSPAATSRSTPGWRTKLRHSSSGISAIEVNISCPNVEDRGLVFACDPLRERAVVDGVRRNSAPGVPVFAKLSPDVTDIVAIARACVDAGADGLSMINTLLGVVIDTDTMRPHLAGITGGLSGPGDPTGGRARRVAGAPGDARRADHRHGRHPDRPATPCEFILAGASRGARSARPSSTTRRHRCASCDELQRAARPSAASTGWPTPSGYAHRPTTASDRDRLRRRDRLPCDADRRRGRSAGAEG